MERRSVLREWVRLSADLVAVSTIACLSVVVVVFAWVPQVVRVPIGVVAVLFAPGYALVSLLFPRRRSGAGSATFDPDGFERAALTVGTSAAVTTLFAVPLLLTPVRLTDVVVTAYLGAVTVLASGGAAVRRSSADDWRGVSWGTRATEWRRSVRPTTTTEAVLNGAVVLAVLALAASLLAPPSAVGSAPAYTSLYIVPDGSSANTTGYPTSVPPNTTTEIRVGVENYERTRTSYTVVAQLQRLESEDGRTVVRDRTNLGRFDNSVAPGATWQFIHDFDPPAADTQLRLVYLLYIGSPPETPTLANAYREVHLLINVSGEGSPRASMPADRVPTATSASERAALSGGTIRSTTSVVGAPVGGRPWT